MVLSTNLIALLSICYLPAFVATSSLPSELVERSQLSPDSETSPVEHSTLQKRSVFSQEACDPLSHVSFGDWQVLRADCLFFDEDYDGRDFDVTCVTFHGPGGTHKTRGKCPEGTVCYPIDKPHAKAEGDITCATPKQVDIWQTGSEVKEEQGCSESFKNTEDRPVNAWLSTSVSNGKPKDIEYFVDGRRVGPIFHAVALGVVKVILGKGQSVKACVETGRGSILHVITKLLGTTRI
ncbi:hypothetical protein HRS9122_08014 [Pyrenophora teres f. teres]|nr:hypothetical protein HRS9122_08014 [Pyrenophora teres f. teres]